MNKMIKLLKVLLPVLLIAAAVGGFVYLKSTKANVKPRPLEERSWAVATVAAKTTDLSPTIRVFGEIVSGRDADLRPLVAGRIVEVNPALVEGGTLRAGDLLVAIDPFDYQTEVNDKSARLVEAEAKLDELRAEQAGNRVLLKSDLEQVALNRTEAERRERLLKTGAGTQKSLDDARLTLNVSRQQVASRRQTLQTLIARIAQSEAAVAQAEVALIRARHDLENTRLTAPHDGVLMEVDAAVGKQVATGDRVARLIAIDRLEARFLLSGDQYARLLADGGFVGRPVEVTWRVGRSAFTFPARIDRAEGEIDAAAGGVRLYAEIGGTSLSSPLRPGAFVEVVVPDRTYKDVLQLPESALHEGDDGGPIVYRVEDSRLHPVSVETVTAEDGRVLVRGPFDPGQRIVTTRFPQMGPGVKVEVR